MRCALRDVIEVAHPRGALLGNGGSVEEFSDDLHDFGFGVEPFDEFISGLAVANAIVELLRLRLPCCERSATVQGTLPRGAFPDFSREVCDFTVTVLHVGFVVEFCVANAAHAETDFHVEQKV